MKFGANLEGLKIPGWETHYINYNKLKDVIEAARVNDNLFAKAIIAEEKRLGYFVAGKISEVIDKLDFCLGAPIEQFEDNKHVAAQLREEIANIGEFINVNKEGIRKILKKYQKLLGRATTWHDPDTWLARATHTVDQLIITLSQYYAKHFPATEWAPPSSFERKTTKYWVRMEDIMRIKLFIIQYLPILEIHKTPYPSRDLDVQPPTQIHNYISSLYLDNSAFKCYHDRIEKQEGAQLLRIRWYGGKCSTVESLPSPDPSDVLYLERKEHHESWVEEKSTKLRFPLNQALLSSFMTGSLSAHDAVEFMVHQGAIKKKEVGKLEEVAENFQRDVLQHGLRPVLRTTYHRTAFQLSNNNDVRISLDAPMYITQENTQRPSPFSSLANDEPYGDHFPYGVLEIKLAGSHPPAWVEELLSLVEVTAVPKFSKYQQGVADFYHQSVRLLPYWLEELKARTGYDKIGFNEGNEDSVAPNTTALAPTASAVASEPEIAAPLASPPGPSTSLATADSGTSSQHLSSASPAANADTKGKEAKKPGGKFWALVGNNSQRGPQTKTISDEKPAEGTHASTKPAHTPAPAALVRASKRSAATSPTAADAVNRPPAAKVQRPLKIEPKTYFANERTYIQWMSAGVLIFSLSVALMTINPTSRTVGLVLFPISILFFAYALWLFNWRLRKINARDRSNYFDDFGPWFFSIALCLTAAVSLAVIWSAYAQDPLTPPPNLFCSDAPPVCLQSSTAAHAWARGSSPFDLSIGEYLFFTSSQVLNINQSLGAYNCSIAATPPARRVTDVEWERTQQYYCESSEAAFPFVTESGLTTCNWPDAQLPTDVSLTVRYKVEQAQLEAILESSNISALAAASSVFATSSKPALQVVVQCPAPVYRLVVAVNVTAGTTLTSTSDVDRYLQSSLFSHAIVSDIETVYTEYGAYLPYGMTIAGSPVIYALEPIYSSSTDRAALVNPPANVRLSMVITPPSSAAGIFVTPTQMALQQTAKSILSATFGNGYVVNKIDVNIVIAETVCAIVGFVILVALGIQYGDKFFSSIRQLRHRPASTAVASNKPSKPLQHPPIQALAPATLHVTTADHGPQNESHIVKVSPQPQSTDQSYPPPYEPDKPIHPVCDPTEGSSEFVTVISTV